MSKMSTPDALATPIEQGAEYETMAAFHDMAMANEVLSAKISELVDVVAYVQTDEVLLKRTGRELNDITRKHYKQFIYNTGRNLYPVILALDHETLGPKGIGSTFKLLTRDGSVHYIQPARDTDYELYKGLSHCALGLFITLMPYAKVPATTAYHHILAEFRGKLVQLRACVTDASQRDEAFKTHMHSLIDTYVTFIDTVVSDKTFALQQFLDFTATAFERIKVNMARATTAQAEACVPALLQWRAMLGPEEWRKLYVVIPTVWPVALNSPRLQLFQRIMDADRLHTHIITSEFPRSEEEMLDTLGRVVGDRAVGRLVFGTADTKAKMKVLALSSRTDVVADDSKAAFDVVFDRLRKDGVTSNPPLPPEGSSSGGACPYDHTSGAPAATKESVAADIAALKKRLAEKEAQLAAM